MDREKREIDILREKHRELHSMLIQKQILLNEAAFLAIYNRKLLSESEDVTYYKNCVHELTLQLKELERQIDILKEQDKSGMS